ncbi:MAG: 4a-hydroxytetrahydrobiopterin dehydratase, partial [Nocardioidaceae bacterium]
ILTGQQIRGAQLGGWRVVDGRLRIEYATGSFARGAELVAAIAPVADQHDHHPDVELSYPHVGITVWSHDVGALTARDIRLARAISALAHERGIPAES